MSHEVTPWRLETPSSYTSQSPPEAFPGQAATLISVSAAPSSLSKSPGAWEEASPAGQPQLSGSHRLQSQGGRGTCRVGAHCGQRGWENAWPAVRTLLSMPARPQPGTH